MNEYNDDLNRQNSFADEQEGHSQKSIGDFNQVQDLISHGSGQQMITSQHSGGQMIASQNSNGGVIPDEYYPQQDMEMENNGGLLQQPEVAYVNAPIKTDMETQTEAEEAAPSARAMET